MHQLHIDQLVQPPQRADFEALHEDRIVGIVQIGFAQGSDQQVHAVDARFLQQEGRMLEFRIKADGPARFGLFRADELHDLGKGRHGVKAIETRIGRPQAGQALGRAQAAQFGQSKVLGEPA